ncbi:MAG: hypothetical protein WDW36_003105 [Sanguina aurantia]
MSDTQDASVVTPTQQLLVWLQDPTVQLALSLVVGVIFLRFLYRLLFGRASGSTVVIVGPCGAGKTTLLTQLRDGSVHSGTVSSMQENEALCKIQYEGGRSKVAKVIDVPGHPRLRHKLEQHLKDALVVVYVIDAADITPHKLEAAEGLFEVLTHPHISGRKINVLLACNKVDLETQAHSVDFIRRTLEKQLDAMRKTRMALTTDGGGFGTALGRADRSFTLSAARSPISMASISAEHGDLKELHQFLSRLIR